MFEGPRYIQNSFSITFQRDSQVRRKANKFEDLLHEGFEGHYGQPQVIPIPDDLDPEVPRMIFSSRHGFSQIIVSQISMTLNVTYSPDWQMDIAKGKSYLKKRSQALFSLLEALGDIPAFFSGLNTRVRLHTARSETDFLKHFRDRIGISYCADPLHDVLYRETTVHREKFFSNISIQNFRSWSFNQPIQGVPRYSKKAAADRGVEIIGDFNDRYAYNEDDGYFSSSGVGPQIIDLGLAEVDRAINKLEELARE
jgi:hypothetical protein